MRPTPRSLPFARAMVFAFTCLGAPVTPAVEDGAPWTVATQGSDLIVYERVRKGSDLREFKAVGTIAAPPAAVKRVLDDVEAYPRFMPYVAEARVLSRDAKSRVSYQRLAPPLVGDRDYTIRVHTETLKGADGVGFRNRWEAANDLGPAEKKGVTRVTITEGSWLLEPTDAGRQTRATYSVFSDSGSRLPNAIVNAASRTAIPKVFDSVRKQVKLEKYSRD